MPDVKIGDPVEYKIIDRDEGEKWIPATVTHIDFYQICVQDANNEKRVIPRRSKEWRRSHN